MKEGVDGHSLVHFLNCLEGNKTEDHLKIRISMIKGSKALSLITSTCVSRCT